MKFCKGTGTVLCMAALPYFPAANAVAIKLPETSLLQQPSNLSLAQFANITSLNDYPNPRFEARGIFGDLRLRSISLLMNAVEALATLALKDLTARSRGTHFHAERYEDVTIDVVPQHPATDILNEVALSCIFYGIGHVIREGQYVNAELECLWDEVVVAQVFFDRPGYHQSSSNTTEALSSPMAETSTGSANNNSSSLTTTTTTTTTNATLLEAVNPFFHFGPDSRTLPIPGVFNIVLVAITCFAYCPKTDTVPPYTQVKSGHDGIAQMLFVPYRRRTRPPFFEYRWLIESLRQLPAFLLQQGRFAEISMGIVVDGVHVGNGLLEKAVPDGLAEKMGATIA